MAFVTSGPAACATCAPPMKLALAAATTAAVLPVAFKKARRVVFLLVLMLIEVVIPLSLLRSVSLGAALPASRWPRDDAPRRPTPSSPRSGAICRLAVASPGWLQCDAGRRQKLKVHANRRHSKFVMWFNSL